MKTPPSTNWAASFRYGFRDCVYPTSVEALCETVAQSKNLKVLGSRHSFNAIADGDLAVILSDMPVDPVVEADGASVSVGGHATYGELASFLNERKLAIHNLASLPHISIAGAIATATHGSGDRNGNLATAVSAIEFVSGDGTLVRLKRGDPDFAGAAVHLGALGVITRVTLDVVPEFEIAQGVYEGLSWPALLENLDAIMGAGYSVSVFSQWGEQAGAVWLKRKAGADSWAEDMFGAVRSTVKRHPIIGLDPQNSTDQLQQYGRWSDRLPHFKMGFTPSNGEEIQSEYHVPRRYAGAAIEALLGIRERFAHLIQASEFRTVAADDLWLSPQYQRDTLSIHFTWVREQAAVEEAVSHIEKALSAFEALPHWGKVFSLRPIGRLYPKFTEFSALRDRLDPQRKFSNRWLETVLS